MKGNWRPTFLEACQKLTEGAKTSSYFEYFLKSALEVEIRLRRNLRFGQGGEYTPTAEVRLKIIHNLDSARFDQSF